MGLFSKAFSPKKPIQRRSASLNNLVAMDPTIRQREFNPDPATPVSFKNLTLTLSNFHILSDVLGFLRTSFIILIFQNNIIDNFRNFSRELVNTICVEIIFIIT